MRAIPPYILSMRIADLAYRIDFARACLPGREAVTVGESTPESTGSPTAGGASFARLAAANCAAAAL